MKNSHLVHSLEFNDNYFWGRLAITGLLGIIIAGLLTLFMHTLIAFSQQELNETSIANFLDFVRVKREETSQPKKVKPERPKTQKLPQTPMAPQTSQSSLSDLAIQISMPKADTSVNVDIGLGINTGDGDGEYLPIVKIAPAYPVKASIEGTEGNCAVEFTVTSTGATKDVEAVPGECPQVFIRSSIAAARKFKYKPRIIDGEAIEVPNVRNIFKYTLKDREDYQ